jgi:hypothetical protein
MYSENSSDNKKKYKPKKLLYLDKAGAVDAVKDMVKTGESNVGFMIEVIRCNWDLNYKKAQQLVLEGVMLARNN